MLSEQVLELLTRDAPLRQLLVEEAWPDLTVESKLQLITATQKGAYATTSSWLMQLSIKDPAAIVRYWAARHYSFADEKAREWPAHLDVFNRPIPEVEKELRTLAVSDSSNLVKACTSKNPWETAGQLERLVFIRSNGTSGLISGLNKALDAGLDSVKQHDRVNDNHHDRLAGMIVAG